jgi:hypothetical protein
MQGMATEERDRMTTKTRRIHKIEGYDVTKLRTKESFYLPLYHYYDETRCEWMPIRGEGELCADTLAEAREILRAS